MIQVLWLQRDSKQVQKLKSQSAPSRQLRMGQGPEAEKAAERAAARPAEKEAKAKKKAAKVAEKARQEQLAREQRFQQVCPCPF
jgi:hypothetical protein